MTRRPNQSLPVNPLAGAMTSSQHVYEVRPRKDRRGVDLISDALPFDRLWYGEPNTTSNAVDYAKFFSRSHNAVIRIYDILSSTGILLLKPKTAVDEAAYFRIPKNASSARVPRAFQILMTS